MKKLIYTICLAALFVSCKQDNVSDIDDDGEASVVLNLKAQNPSSESRATEPGIDNYNENKIKSLHVFVFPENATDSQLCLVYESHDNLTFNGTVTHTQDLTMSKSSFTQGAMYDIYTIANLPSDVSLPNPLTLGAIKSLRTATALKAIEGQFSFVMDSKSSAVLNPGPGIPVVYVNINLKRAVSKVRITINIDPTSPVIAAFYSQASLRHHANQSSMLDLNPYLLTAPDYYDSPYVTHNNVNGKATIMFYCYENNWATTSSGETYLMVNIPYPGRPTNYYRFAVNKYADHPRTGRTERNMIYDVNVYVNSPGSETESAAVSTAGNCTILDWTTKDVILKTINQHYLGISEYNIVMPNISTFTLKYVSDLPVSVTGVTAMCTQYSISGVPSNVTYSSGQAQFPTFVVNAAASTITVNSAIPINYVPKYMTFTVTNNQGLSLSTTIVQYPPRYVNARLSTGNIKPEWIQGGTNLNLFTVNTLVPSNNGSYTLGDPTNGFSKTDSTATGNTMVSPRFIIASQYGVYNRVLYGIAQNRCASYGEDIYRSGWRMPTKAEIELINVIQDDVNSAVKALLTGDAYWSAFKYDYYNFVNNSWIVSGATGTAYIRCVYDIYKTE